MHPLVTVGIPTYNRYVQLRHCLASVTRQDYENIEILIADNSDIDPVPTWLLELLERDKRIIYVKHSLNLGMIGNDTFIRNHSSTAPYLCVIHDDDEIPENYVSSLMSVLFKNPDYALVGPRCTRYFCEKFWYEYESYSTADMSQSGRLRDLISRAFNNPWSFEHLMYGIYRRDAIPKSFAFGRWRSIILFFYLLGIVGHIQTEQNIVIKKNTTKRDLQKYSVACYVNRYSIFRVFFSRRIEQRLTILYRLVKFTLTSPHLSLGMKLTLCFFALKKFSANHEEFTYSPPNTE